MGFTRRDFMKGAAAAGALVSVPGMISRAHASPKEKGQKWAFENRIPSVCTLCPGGCGIMARIYKKKVIGIAGNPLHPVNLGGLCPKGIAATQMLYNPDRIKYPMKQEKGSGRWQKISWDEALKIVSEKLAALRSQGNPHTLVSFAGNVMGLMRASIKNFMRAYGSPNFIDIGHFGKTDLAFYLMQGNKTTPVYDIARSSYVLSLNSDFLDSYPSPVHMMRSYGEMRSNIGKERGKMVHAGPRLSTTAIKSDEWVAIKPGTEGALALGIAHIILKERLNDEQFTNLYTNGFDDFRVEVLKDYSPFAVSNITGISTETIIRIAREFARFKPAIALPSSPSSFNYQNVYTRMAIHCLNALVGSIDIPGGVLTPRSSPPYSEDVQLDEVAKNGLAMPAIEDEIRKKQPLRFDTSNFVPQKCLTGLSYKPNVMMLFEVNPVYNNIFSEEYKQLLQSTNFVISFSSFFDETTQYADIVLPNHIFLEGWGDFPTFTNSGYPVVGLQQPVVGNFYDTRHTGDVLISLSKNLGETLRKSFPEDSFKDMLTNRFKTIQGSSQGNVFGPQYETKWTQLLEKSGWKGSPQPSFESSWETILQRGGWFDPLYYYGEWNRVFKTGSRKFEFAPSMLSGVVIAEGAGEKGLQNIPHYEPPPVRANDEYPLILSIFTPLVFHSAIDSNVPWLQNISGAHVNYAWNTWVEINPDTAEQLGLRDNGKVIVESHRGKIFAIVKIFKGITHGVVAIPFGMGRKAEGRWQKDLGTNPLDVVDKNIDTISGETIWNTTQVKVYKSKEI